MAKQPTIVPDFLADAGPGGKVGQILDAARHLFLEQGYGNTSMDGVAIARCLRLKRSRWSLR